ncbi:MAG: wax ester/triacylglycerol synthase domain-containing protein, partial [Mycobacterium sp.]
MREPSVRQLSWTDDMMLRAEGPATPLQIQMLLIYDPSTAPNGKVTFKGILEELDARLHLADVFRRRLTGLPGGFDRPYWVDDPNFDLEYHVRHIGLPQPGDWRQLCIQVARLHARQIDLRRPPWEITVIEGLNSVPGVPKGSFAMALKLHHCAVDGMASVQMIAAMHDLAADSQRPAGPDRPWHPAPLPTTANLFSRTAIDAALYPMRAGATLASSAPKIIRGLAGLPGKLVGGLVSSAARGGVPSFPPKTRFNQIVSPHRVFDARFHDLADFKRIKASVPGSTVNDVALAYVGGALREYLEGHGELPDESLVAACPISLREAGDESGKGNVLFGRLQTLGTDIADPIDRLASIAASTAGSRSESDHSVRTQVIDLIGTV